MSEQKIDWIIHLVGNGVACDCCNKVEDEFHDGLCNAHTHGMEKYHHPDFQMVIQVSPEEIGYVLNTLGRRVQNGEQFHDGDYVSGIYEDCDIRLQEFEETGRKVLRVLIPDMQNIFPDNPRCNHPFNLQLLETDKLYK